MGVHLALAGPSYPEGVVLTMEQQQTITFPGKQAKRPVSVVCLKWGTPYPAEYVNVLQRAVSDHLSYQHRFVCITDTPAGLAPEVEAITLPEIPIEKKKWASGYWPKLAMFKEGMFAEDELVLYLDVDIVINQSLNPFVDLIDKQGGLRIIREWNPDIWHLLPDWMRPDRGGNSSVVGFIFGEQVHLFDDFAKAPEEMYSKYGNDQRFITYQADNRQYWPDRWCASFRRTCVPHWPLNLIFRGVRKPSLNKIFVFHGKPDPTDMIEDGDYRWGTKWRYGFGPVEWVQKYWRKYSDAA